MALLASLLLAAFVPAPAAAAGPTITHERLGENGYRLHLTVPSARDAAAGSRLLERTVRSLCGDLHPRFGRWEAVEPVRVPDSADRPPAVQLTQDVTCEAEPPPAVAAPTPAVVAPDWTPTAADELAVRAATDTFFDAREAERFDEAYAFLVPGFDENQTLEAFAARSRDFNQDVGRRINLRLVALTWYNNNLPGAPPGLYAAVDFVGAYENLHFTCGYVIWQLQADGSWRLVTVNQAVASRTALPNPSAEDLSSIRAQMRCRA